MPLVFLSLSDSFTETMRGHGLEAHTMRVEEFRPRRTTYYVSPANSLCFMDGGIDYALSRVVFPGIEPEVKRAVSKLGKTSLVGKPYLPIGSSLVLPGNSPRTDAGPETYLCVAPTMLLPQNVAHTQNAYYATVAVLYHVLVHRKQNLEDVDILLTSFCCGYGRMEEDECIRQMLRGIREYAAYRPTVLYSSKEAATAILHEPNLADQPRLYQNTEFFAIAPADIVHC